MVQDAPLESNDISPREFLSVLRRRKAVIIQTFLVIVAVGVLITFVTKPVYRSLTRILVEGKSLTVSQVDSNDPMSSLFAPTTGYDVGTQIEVLQSESVQNRACDAAKIPKPTSGIGLTRPVKLTIKQVADTNVIEIMADSTTAAFATALAKQLPKTYRNYITGNRQQEVKDAFKFSQQRMDQEQRRLDYDENKLERFRAMAGVLDSDSERANRTQQASQVEADIRKAEAEVSSNQARLNSLTAELNALPPFIEMPVTSTNNTQIDAQKDRISLLEADRAKLLVLFKPNSSEVAKLDAQIAELKTRLAQTSPTVTSVSRTINPAIVTFKEKVADARATLIASKAELDDTRALGAGVMGDKKQYGTIEGRLAHLQRDVERDIASVAALSKSVDDLGLRDHTVHDPVLVITPATDAEKIAPKPVTNLALAILLGLTLGIGFAMLQEYLDDRINTAEEARLLTGKPSLGFVPLVSNTESRLLGANTGSSMLESYRVLRSNVQFAAIANPVKSLQVTSTNPGEGKSTTAANIAIAMAMDGRRVILVDADLRRPTVHEKLGITQTPGLTNVLLGQLNIENALRDSEIPGLRILTAGSLPPNSAELLNSAAMRDLHEQIKEYADIVIFDSPPCLATADAQVLSSILDGVLYVVQLGDTKKAAVQHSIQLLEQAHARILGIVFNKIDMVSNSNNYYYSFDNYYHKSGDTLPQNEMSNGNIESVSALTRRNGTDKSHDVAVVDATPQGSEKDS